MILAQASDDVSHQRGVHGCIAIDNQHASWVVLAQNALEQRIVLETLHRGDRTGELRGATQIGELRIAATHVFADDVHQISGRNKSHIVLWCVHSVLV